MKCPYCGRENSEKDKVCYKCKAAINREPKEEKKAEVKQHGS